MSQDMVVDDFAGKRELYGELYAGRKQTMCSSFHEYYLSSPSVSGRGDAVSFSRKGTPFFIQSGASVPFA